MSEREPRNPKDDLHFGDPHGESRGDLPRDLPEDLRPGEHACADRYAEAIDAFARGTLDDTARAELSRAAERDPALRARLDDAIAVRRLVTAARLDRSFGLAPGSASAREALSQRILAAIDAETSAAAGTRSRHPQRSPAPGRRPWLWSWGTAVAALLLWMLVGPDTHGPSAPRSSSAWVEFDGVRYPRAEVEAAVEELETALAVLDHTMQRTGSIVREEVRTEWKENVTEPLLQGFGRTVRSIPYLPPRTKNVEHSSASFPPRGEC